MLTFWKNLQSRSWRARCDMYQVQSTGNPDQNVSWNLRNTNIQTQPFHSLLFRYHVLDDSSIPDPGYPPYYPASFFQTIKHVHLNTTMNILNMSIKQWTMFLTEEGLIIEDINRGDIFLAGLSCLLLTQAGNYAGNSPATRTWQWTVKFQLQAITSDLRNQATTPPS